ncbi:Lectin MVL [Calothrix sp. NIES-4071]|nr:Lectin MVL [Calothrix sp. NIES-4071]BAZ54965.1 Lectin MVL [Calothrix sp. NIES-4105]
MSNNSVQSITKKFLLPLGTFIVGGSMILGASQAFAGDVNAGPIWNNNHARQRCPQVCNSVGLRWTGGWYTNDPGRNSVCDCVGR